MPSILGTNFDPRFDRTTIVPTAGKPVPQTDEDEDAWSKQTYINNICGGPVSNRPEVQQTIAKQYDYNKMRVLSGKDPLKIADVRWDPTAYDDAMNEWMNARYQMTGKLPSGEERLDYFRDEAANKWRGTFESSVKPTESTPIREMTQTPSTYEQAKTMGMQTAPTPASEVYLVKGQNSNRQTQPPVFTLASPQQIGIDLDRHLAYTQMYYGGDPPKTYWANQAAIDAQFDYNDKRNAAGLKPLAIADFGWDPRKYDDATNEWIAQYYEQNGSMPIIQAQAGGLLGRAGAAGSDQPTEGSGQPTASPNQPSSSNPWAEQSARIAADLANHVKYAGTVYGGDPATAYWSNRDVVDAQWNNSGGNPTGEDHNEPLREAPWDTKRRENEQKRAALPLNATPAPEQPALPVGNAAALKVLNPILAYEMGLGGSFSDWALQLQASTDPDAQQALNMFDDMRDKHPLAYTLGDATGQIAQAALLEGPVFSALGKGLPIASKLVRGAVSGGLSNALVGAVHDVSRGKDANEVAMNLLTNAAFGSLGDAGLRMVGDLAGSYVPKAGTALYEKMLQNGELIRRLRPVAEPLANAFVQSARRLAGDALPAEEAATARRFNPRAEALETAKEAANKAANLADEIPREYTGNEDPGETFIQGSKIPDELLRTKPSNSPAVSKWLDGGGKIDINNGTWKYTNSQGVSVSYINGYPDFKGSGHVVQEIDIGPFNERSVDFKLADQLAPNGPKSPRNTWHHHEDGRTLQEVNRRTHEMFTHKGGISIMKKGRK